ncbi:extracellular solute-binding protein [Blautia sp. HCP3S3_C12]|uniref:extracellular solute-binding protein n=1 Tax=unclassified Blautia TaxID=2648079 RepID=UPI003F8B1999
MRKKVVSLITSAVMVTSVFAGMPMNVAAADDDKVITFWSIGTNEPDATILQRAVDTFNETTTSGYTAELVNYPTDNYKEKLTIAMSSGECPDVYTNWTGGPLTEYINAGFAQPVTDLVKEMGLDSKVMASGLAQGSVNDEIYALPVLNIAIEGFYYNKDLFEQVGITEKPTTISELEADCDKLVEAGITPFALANQSKWTGSMFFMGLATRYAGLKPFQDAYAGTGSFEDECFKYAGEKIIDWVEKGYFPEGVNSLSFDDGQDKQLMYQETAAMTLQGTWQTSTFKADSEEFYQKIGWFPFPAVDGSDADASIQIGTVGDCFATFNCTGDKLKAAVELVSCFYTDENVQYSVDAGYLPPVTNVADLITDEISVENLNAALDASSIQLWYDQYLPPAVSEVHQSTCQELFGESITPEEADKELQQAMQDYLAENAQ